MMDAGRLAALLGIFAVLATGCGGDTTNTTVEATCDAETTALCICPGPTIGEQICEDGTPGGCDCSAPINPGECTADAVSAACICDDGQIGEQTCVDGEAGECECPDPIPEGQCRSDLDCDDGSFCNGVERCNPEADMADARGCVTSSTIRECDDGVDCTVDSCSDELNRCTFTAPDADADGHRDASCVGFDGAALGDDCDDTDPDRYPGNPEVCAEGNFDHDEDCDPDTYGVLDRDGDGAIDDRCCNGDACGTDCDDTTIARRQGQPEFCDNRDNDCDEVVDEETGEVNWYADADGDGFGGVDGIDTPVSHCIPQPGRSLVATDCNDADPGKHPAQLERCDLRDNNCNLIADDGGLCPYDPFAVAPDDEGGVDVPIGGDPICPLFGYPDADGDGFGDNQIAMSLDPEAMDCGLPVDWVTKGNDCDDGAANRNPDEIDVCDMVDNDCDGVVDQDPEASESCELENIDAVCVYGNCEAADGAVCTAPYADCDGLANNGCETDVRVSFAHCGGCGQPCGVGDACSDSTCQGTPYLSIIAGEQFNLLRRPGGVVGWGRSNELQLGAGSTLWSPALLPLVGTSTEITAGYEFGCKRSGGAVWCWGSNDYGQLANGLVGPDTSVPQKIPGIETAVMVRAGNEHACAILEDRTVWCWGRAGHGQLGYSATPAAQQTAPVQVDGITDAVDLLGGVDFTCVLHADKTVSCFGENDNGRLGYDSGANTNVHLPQKVAGLTNVERFAVGSGINIHVCVILTGGSVMCWGYNAFGQLGVGNETDAWSPQVMANISNAKSVSLGYAHSCVVEVAGELKCTGADDVAQIGFPEDQGRLDKPGTVDLGAEKAEHVACGRRHTCAILDSGRVICFGSNQYGTVGAGGSTTSSTGVYPFRETLPAP